MDGSWDMGDDVCICASELAFPLDFDLCHDA